MVAASAKRIGPRGLYAMNRTRLWLLKPLDAIVTACDSAWCSPADCCWAFVIRAESEGAARQLAQAAGQGEVRPDLRTWLDPRLTSCVELSGDGAPEIILQQTVVV